MKYKENWPQARERLCALWEGRKTDRPCIAVTAPSGRNAKSPDPPAQEPERKWLAPEWIVPTVLAQMENTWWGGESIPSYLLMGGWVICLGGKPDFNLDTIWFDTFAVDFDQPSPFVHDPDDEYVRKFTAVYDAVVQAAGKDDFLVGKPPILPANDLLSMHMGTEEFLMALMDHPQWMRNAIENGGRELLKAGKALAERIRGKHDFWYGNAGWMPFWTPQPYASTQSDVSCMLSPSMFEQFVVPELNVYGEEYGVMWYHLDGGDARQHLPRLLSLPYMRVIQYVPAPCEPPNGPGHLELYREIQAAGKIVHIALGRNDIEALVKALDPSLLMLQTGCESIAQGRELLAAAKRWA